MSVTLSSFQVLISEKEIQERLKKIALVIDQTYNQEPLTILCVLKGALCLVSDLSRALTIDFHLETVQCSSYGQGGTTQGALSIHGLEGLALDRRHILIVDDICDTGVTLHALTQRIEQMNVLSVKSLVLLQRERGDGYFRADHSLFQLETDQFVIGYGLDYKECYRGLKDIYTMQPKL